MRNIINNVVNIIFGCQHFNVSRAWTDERGQYKRCLDCGKRLPSVVQFGKVRCA